MVSNYNYNYIRIRIRIYIRNNIINRSRNCNHIIIRNRSGGGRSRRRGKGIAKGSEKGAKRSKSSKCYFC